MTDFFSNSRQNAHLIAASQHFKSIGIKLTAVVALHVTPDFPEPGHLHPHARWAGFVRLPNNDGAVLSLGAGQELVSFLLLTWRQRQKTYQFVMESLVVLKTLTHK